MNEPGLWLGFDLLVRGSGAGNFGYQSGE